jgi:glycosyltransferase involved in cell wall biosynthesis
MKFSIIVPTYNEEKDISATLDRLINLNYIDKEILVVDDSTDSTPEIVKKYSTSGVKLIIPTKPDGRCGARNIGITQASGEIVVILNADVHLEMDFLDRILIHYQNGYDYVLVRSEVENINDLFARYVEVKGRFDYNNLNINLLDWTEGFSCRKAVAINSGLFPVGFLIPICAGEDALFGQSIKLSGAKKKVDYNILVKHVSPASLIEYWNIRSGRGRGSPQVKRFIQHWSLRFIIFWSLLRILKTLLEIIFILPIVLKILRITLLSPRGIRDFLPFCYAWIVEQFAFHYGELKSIVEIINAEQNQKN